MDERTLVPPLLQIPSPTRPPRSSATDLLYPGPSGYNSPLDLSDDDNVSSYRSHPRDAEFRQIFESNQPSQPCSTAVAKKVSVLLLYFERTDLPCADEVSSLEKTFRDTYNFNVCLQSVNVPEGGCHHQTFMKHIVDFVHEADSPDTLLIVYYAGHGSAGTGQLLLHERAKSNKPQPATQANGGHVVWKRVQDHLMFAKASVFVILDCCDAGSISNGRAYEQPFEYLCATAGNDTTPAYGEQTFSKALIDALETLASRKDGFTVQTLWDRIRAGKILPRSQGPIFGSAKESDSWITLAPLPKAGEVFTSISPSGPTTTNRAAVHYLDLRLLLSGDPEASEITTLAQEFRTSVIKSSLPVTKVMWKELGPWSLKNRRRLSRVVKIASLSMALDNKDKQLMDKDEQLMGKDRQLSDKERQLNELRAQSASDRLPNGTNTVSGSVSISVVSQTAEPVCQGTSESLLYKRYIGTFPLSYEKRTVFVSVFVAVVGASIYFWKAW